MGLLSGLRALFGRKQAPPPAGGAFMPAGLDREDDPEIIVTAIEAAPMFGETATGPASEVNVDEVDRVRSDHLLNFRRGLSRIDDDLRGITFAIEYRDSQGKGSTRRITMHDLYRDRRGHIFVQGICHERSALRCFRFDRIQAVIDMDGEVHKPVVYFRDELRVAIDAPALVEAPSAPIRISGTVPALAAPERPGMAQRRVARDGLRLLAGLARADGNLHPDEIGVILDYVAAVADRAGIATSEEDRAALAGYVKRQRPTPHILEECLDRMEHACIEEQRAFVASAVALADADGQQDPAEFEMLMEIRERLTGL